MSNKYESTLGVRFATVDKPPKQAASYKHSYRDYGLFPKSKMAVQPPEVRETYIEIAGRDGELDLSEVLTGNPSYGNRDAKFEFSVVDRRLWDSVYTRLMNEIHGRKMYVRLDDDANYYYTGRLKVNSFKSKKNTATIVVDGYLEPYKIMVSENSERWRWDPFNFETDIARDYSDLTVDGSATYTIIGSKMPVRPKFKASASGMTVTLGGTQYPVATSDFLTPNNFPVLRDEEYDMTFSGNGTVTIRFDIGSL